MCLPIVSQVLRQSVEEESLLQAVRLAQQSGQSEPEIQVSSICHCWGLASRIKQANSISRDVRTPKQGIASFIMHNRPSS